MVHDSREYPNGRATRTQEGLLAWALVNHAGILFQKDLGPDTAKLAERMSSFNPDRTWQKVSDTAPVQ